MANVATMSQLLAGSGARAPAVASRAGALASNGMRTVGVSRISPEQVSSIGKAITTMPVASRTRILDRLKDHKVMIGGTAVTVGGLLALTETELGNQLLSASEAELRELLSLFDSADSRGGDAVAQAYNEVLNARSSTDLEDNYGQETNLGVPLSDNTGVGLNFADVQVRQALTLGYRSIRRAGLSRDDILFLQFVVQRLSPEDLNVLEDELEFLKRF